MWSRINPLYYPKSGLISNTCYRFTFLNKWCVLMYSLYYFNFAFFKKNFFQITKLFNAQAMNQLPIFHNIRFCLLGRTGQSIRFRYVPDPGTLEQRLFREVTKPVIPPINVNPVERRLRRQEENRLRVSDYNFLLWR